MGCGQDGGRELTGLAKRDKMAAGEDHGFDAKSFAGQVLLELEWEEAVIPPRDDGDGLGPGRKVHGSRKGRCDCSPLGVAVARTCGGTS